MKQSILITGASSGIGKATAFLFAEKGWNVAATMRTPTKGADLAAHENIEVVKLDVTDKASINNAVSETLEKFGRIDVLLNNAGYGTFGPAEYATDDQIRTLFDTHVFGVIDLTKAVLPTMRAQKSGILFNVSSIGGVITFPFISLYHSAKWAMEGFSESLSFELADLGIKVKLLEPGAIGTGFLEAMVNHLGEGENDYTEGAHKMMSNFESMTANMSTPELVADVVYDAVTDGTDRVRYLAGADAEQMFAQRREVGDEAFIKGIRQQVLGG
jgi:NAD(P)-dependent dehydrogenase (short-subunit alcohol dehydrogenase family)